jgi:hypothetical protein
MAKWKIILAAMVFTGHLPLPAKAAAWLQEAGRGIVIIKQESAQQEFTAQAGLTYRQKLRFQEIYGEYGLTPRLTFTAKQGREKSSLSNRHATDDLTQSGLRVATPALATGLLPPFTYDILSKLAEPIRLDRQKKAALHIFVMHYAGETAPGFAVELADKIFTPNWSFTQSLRLSQSRSSRLHWSQASWSWVAGYRDRLFYGRQAEIFENAKSGYRDIRQYDFIEYAFRDSPLALRLAHGRLLNVPQLPGGRLTQISLYWRF